MLSPGVHAMLIEAHVEDLARRARNFNEGRILGQAGVATDRRQSSFLARASKLLQRRAVPKRRGSGRMDSGLAIRKRSA